MNPTFALFKFLYQRLAADSEVAALVGTRIYREQAPQGAVFPCVILAFNGGRNRWTIGTCDPLYTEQRVLVKAVTREDGGGFEAADRIVSAVDAAVTGAFGRITASGRIWQLKGWYPVEPVSYLETTGGEQYQHVGSVYEVMVTQG
jgi:hypothetical protein